MPRLSQIIGYAQHISLHASIGENLKNKKSKTQLAAIYKAKTKLYAKMCLMQKLPEKLLIIKTSSLGDVIHCLPVIHDIRAHYPNIQIDWIVEESFADIPRMAGGVNQVLTVAMRRWKKSPFNLKTWLEISAFKKNIKQYQYDAVIDCQGLLKSALITKQARTTIQGLKHGYDKNSIREPVASLFYERKHAISYQQHAVTRNRALCATSLGYAIPLNAPDYGISAKNNAAASRIDIGLQRSDLKHDYVIGLHGTSRASKLWSAENWVALGCELAKLDLNLALPWANEAEFKRANAIASQLTNARVNNCIVLPKLSIAQLAGVIAQSKAAIGVDTGLSHLATALNVPTIAIFTDTNPALTGVMAGAYAKALNLGNISEAPSVDDVLSSLEKILPQEC
jgi:heptosyltransferase-1